MNWNTRKKLVNIVNDLTSAKKDLSDERRENLVIARQKIIEATALIREYLIDNEVIEE